MDRINILSVAKEFLSLVKESHECEDTHATEEETEIAKLLLEKFEDLIYEYMFVEEEEYFNGIQCDYVINYVQKFICHVIYRGR